MKKLQHKLSFSGKVSALLAISAVVSSPALAEINAANNNTQVMKQGNVEVINIASPNDSGLSHNKYEKFNVNKAGAVLNNSQVAGQSQLAGKLNANPNLNKQSAKVILNEVVSRNPSLLLGKQEVFGMAADYVLANPNGITCDGCGFINTNKASLVVGKPNIEDQKLKSYTVEGDKKLVARGNIATDKVEVVNLIAPQIETSAQIKASKEINVIAGQNKISAENGIEKLNTKQGNVVYDGKVAGSMQAGRIRIHSNAGTEITAAHLDGQTVEISGKKAEVKGTTTLSQSRDGNHKMLAGNHRVDTSNTHRNQHYQGTEIHADSVLFKVEDDLNVKGAKISGKKVVLDAGKTHLGVEKTTNTEVVATKQAKGRWYHLDEETRKQDQIHRTEISATEAAGVTSRKGYTDIQAAKVTTPELAISGKNGVLVHGAVESADVQTTADFKNETAKLKTGTSSKHVYTEKYVASEFNTEGDVLINSDTNIHLKGVVGNIQGTLATHAKGSVNIGTERTKNKASVDDQEKYWGGLAGGLNRDNFANATIENGANIIAGKQVLAKAGNGVNVSGSRVIGKQGGLVETQKGNLVIDSVVNTKKSHTDERLGTIFNITKNKTNQDSSVQTRVGSVLRSEANLDLVSGKNVKIEASTVSAAQKLGISAVGNVDILGAKNTSTSNSHQSGFSFTANLNVPQPKNVKVPKKLEEMSVADIIDAALDINGKIKDFQAGKAIDQILGVEIVGGIGLHIYDKSLAEHSVTHTGANVSGGSVDIHAKENVKIAGSQVSSTEGDLSIQGKKISTEAQKDSKNTHAQSTNVDIGLTAKASSKGLNVNLGIEGKHQSVQDSSSTAQTSQLNSAKDINLSANQISHQGTQINAQGNVNQKADVIKQTAAANTAHKDQLDVGAKLGINVNVSASKALDVNVGLEANGGRKNGTSSEAVVTNIQGQNINANAQRIQDQGTVYNAKNDVNLQAHNYVSSAAHNTKQETENKGYGKVGVGVSTQDFQTANVKVSVGAGYQHNDSSASEAVNGKINANNVNIQANNNLVNSADINATGNVNLQAGNHLALNHTTNKEQKTAGGFNAKVEVGAIVVPAAGAAVPSVGVNVDANYHNSHANNAVVGNVAGKNVAIQAGKTVVANGVNINGSQSVAINAQNVTVNAAKSDSKTLDVKVGAETSVGANTSDLSVGANLAVVNENAHQAAGTSVTGANVTINGKQNVNLQGAKVEGGNVTLNANNLNVIAAQNQEHKTNGGFSLGLSGGLKDQKWDLGSGNASVDVDIARNQTHTESGVKADSLKLNVENNATLVGSQIEAKKAEGHVNGTLTTEDAVNKVNEFALSASAQGSGKFEPYTKENFKDHLKDDWNNNTIAGIGAEANLNVNHNQKVTISPAKVNVQNSKLNTKKVVHKPANVRKRDGHFKLDAHVDTNLKAHASTIVVKRHAPNVTSPIRVRVGRH